MDLESEINIYTIQSYWCDILIFTSPYPPVTPVGMVEIARNQPASLLINDGAAASVVNDGNRDPYDSTTYLNSNTESK